ncbi:hypothetical protein [Corallococcus macrosporus]|uniref:DUF7716 domain-containing protein n=1 Tax=Corallococcus macrosporus TaxID=35 RepID=UPI000F4FE80B|nr:hypothetical protein [Corallococcus macrosporus]
MSSTPFDYYAPRIDSFEWLGNVLANTGSYPTHARALYVEEGLPFDVKTRVMVLERAPYSDELPEAARRFSLIRIPSVLDASDVVENARQQKSGVLTLTLVDGVRPEIEPAT